MRCHDITDTLVLRLDPEDRLVAYTLEKKTCGRRVGPPDLLAAELRGRTPEAILRLDPENPPGARTDDSEIDRFLATKHLVAVQTALEVLTGRAEGGVGTRCVVARIAHDAEGLVLEVDLALLPRDP